MTVQFRQDTLTQTTYLIIHYFESITPMNIFSSPLVSGQRGDVCLQVGAVFIGDRYLKFVFETFTFQGIFPAGETGAKIRASSRFLAGVIDEYMPIGCPYNAQKLALGFRFPTGDAGTQGDMLWSFCLFTCRFYHLSPCSLS